MSELIQPSAAEARNGWTPESLTAYLRDAMPPDDFRALLAGQITVEARAAVPAQPIADRNSFERLGGYGHLAGRGVSNHFVYRNRTHTMVDYLRPGYVSAAVARDVGLHPWDIVEFVSGATPAEAMFKRAIVLDVPSGGAVTFGLITSSGAVKPIA
jgi:hypothetical protein